MTGLHAHPLAKQYPLLEGEEYEAFKQDIAANGLRCDIWLYEGAILDGRNRYRACRELDIEPTFQEFAGDPIAAEAFARSLNEHRRHLTAEFRDQRIRERRARGESIRKIAKDEGVGTGTVHRALHSGVPTGTPDATPNPPALGKRPDGDGPPEEINPASPIPPKVQGRDGKQYAAQKPAQRTPQAKKQPGSSSEARPLGLNGVGVVKANEAIGCLSRIPKNDPLRARGLQMVMDWIEANQEDGQPTSEARWCEVHDRLQGLAALIESLGPFKGESVDPCQLIRSLEQTGRALVQRAHELRRKLHL